MTGLTEARLRAISPDHLGGYAAYLGGPLGRIFHDLGLELLEAVAACLDEFLVVEILGDEHVHEAVEEGDVASHLDGQMMVAKSASACFRGSTTMSSGALQDGVLEKGRATGWASVMLDPMTRNILAFSNSPKELVIAPEPNEVARPATVGACQVRAQ